MLKTTEPVIIMTKAELEAVIDASVKKAVAEVMKAIDNIKLTSRSRVKGDASSGLLRMPQVLDRVGLKKTVIYERIKAGTFPKPIKLGSASAWHTHEIDGWIAGQSAGWPSCKSIPCTELGTT